MKLTINREQLLRPLSIVSAVVERRQTLPILSNVHLLVKDQTLFFTATDLEVEVTASTQLTEAVGNVDITVPARKLVDICKAAPPECQISFDITNEKVIVRAGRARFTLASMDASEYPQLAVGDGNLELMVANKEIRALLNLTHFAMAQQDVRYYLNGLLFDLVSGKLTVVGTEGHRLALATLPVDFTGDQRSLIIPRKTVFEMIRILDDSETPVKLSFGTDHFTFDVGDVLFRSKVIDGKFPEYQRVIPSNLANRMECDRKELKDVVARVSILANEKYRAVRFNITDGQLSIAANNQENEEAEEELEVSYEGEPLEIGFNASYFVDVLNALETDRVVIEFGDSNSSCLIYGYEGDTSRYVIMPMRL